MNLLNGKKSKLKETWLIAAVMFLLLALSGCSMGENRGSGEQERTGNTGNKGAGDKLTVVTTLFPYYDFTRQIAGDKVELSLIIPAGMDSHSFEPTPKDIRTMQNADVIIANGGAMELWVDQVVGSLNREDLTVVTMMDYVDVVEEEIVEGMEDSGDEHNHVHAYADDSHDHDNHEYETEPGHEAEPSHEAEYGHETEHAYETDHDAHAYETDHSHDDHVYEAEHDHNDHTYETDHAHGGHSYEDESQYEIEYDEHIWTSPVNAMKMVQIIADTLSEADPENKSAYEAAAASYIEKLKALDGEFRAVRAEAVHDIIIMGDKFPLRYFADEYDLRYRAAFSGCSSDTEPSARTIAYLIDKVKEEQLPVIFYLELSSHRVAEIIAEETGAEPLLFHSCHNVTRREFEDGVTYLTLMEQNVKNLREGLCK